MTSLPDSLRLFLGQGMKRSLLTAREGGTPMVNSPVDPPIYGDWLKAAILAVASCAIWLAFPTAAFAQSFSISVSPTWVDEGDGSTDVTVTATVDGNLTANADTELTVKVGELKMGEFTPATEGADYEAVEDFMITILAGQKSATGKFTLILNEDSLIEGDEYLSVDLYRGNDLYDTENIILDDNDSITLSMDPTEVDENSGPTEVKVTATLDAGASLTDTEVTIKVGSLRLSSFNSATEGTDYKAVEDFRITIPAGQLSKTGMFTLKPINDNLDEGNESIGVGYQVLQVNNNTYFHNMRIIKLVDTVTSNDPIKLSVNTLAVREASESTEVKVTAILYAGASLNDTEVTVKVGDSSSDSATEGTDYKAVEDFRITIPAGQSSATGTFMLTPINDSLDEGKEDLSVDLYLGDDLYGTHDISLFDNYLITLSVNPREVGEAAGSTEVTVMATLDIGASLTDTEVTVKVGHDSDDAVKGTDYNEVEDFMITIPAGQSSATGTFTLTPRDDEENEGDENLSVLGTLSLAEDSMADVINTVDINLIDNDGVNEDEEAEAAVRERRDRVNEEVLPKFTQAIATSTLSAITGRIDSAVSGAASGGLNLADASSLYHTLKANQQLLEDGSFNLAQVLGGSSFTVALDSAEAGGIDSRRQGLGGLALWGSGDYNRLSSNEDSNVDWDGDIFSFHVGVDTSIQPDLLAGLSLSRSSGSFDYTDRSNAGLVVGGTYESRMTGLHPYLNWSLPQGVNLWATAGYGWGEIDINDDVGGTASSDTTMRMGALGASGKLLSSDTWIAGGTTTLKLKGEGSLAQVEVEGSRRISPLTADVQRLRLSVEGSHERLLSADARLTPSLELGLRRDSGDGITGTGLEFGGALRYLYLPKGLTLEAHSRVLIAHEADLEDWGIGGLIRLDPGSSKEGLSVSVAPVYGNVSGSVARLWDQDVLAWQNSDQSANGGWPQGRLEAELGYGLPAPGGDGLLTPYVGLSLAGDGRQDYRLGGRLDIAPSLSLSLEGQRQERPTAPPDHGVAVQAKLDW